MPDKNFIQVAGNTRTDYFDVRRQTRKDGLPIMLPMRNKVLSVLLAAGMVASMPAATAFNVMADDADAVVGADSSVSANYKDPVWTLAEDDPATTNVDETNSYAILNLTRKSDNSTVKIIVDGSDSESATNESFEHKDTTATCTADGTETIIASADFDNHTWTKTFSNVAVKAYGHNYDYKDGKWIWTKTGNKNTDGTDEYAVTFVYSCSRCGNIASTAVPSENISEVIVGDGGAEHTNFYPSCTSNARVNFNAFVKIGDTTYYPKDTATTTTKAYKTNDKGYLVDASGNVLYKKDNAKAPATDYAQLSADDQKKAVEIGFYNDGATDKVAESKDSDFYYTYTPGHDWQVKKDFDWTVKSDYKDAKGNDIYLNTAAKKAKSESDFVLSDHYTNAKVTFACKSPYHTSRDGEKTAEVSAWIYADQDPATCTTDATTTYYAYIFSDEKDVETQVTALGNKLGWSKTTIDIEIANAKKFFNDNQLDNNGKGYGSYQATKTDTWKGTALGHEYYISGWTWSNDFSYVTLNLHCKGGDNYRITVQSSQITKNADGTATVVYTAKDQRKNDTTWYGSADKEDGYYWDQTRNPYGKTFTINALPLKNAGDVNNGKIVMTRLYNKTTGEHLYTSDANEIKTLVNEYNWTNEGTAWNAPAVSNTPVYRMFNRVTGEHVYTRDLNEVNTLSKKDEWNNEGIAWYSDDNKTVPVYRQFNPKAATSKASHNYTTSTNEKNTLTSQYGWNDEGIGWYGV